MSRAQRAAQRALDKSPANQHLGQLAATKEGTRLLPPTGEGGGGSGAGSGSDRGIDGMLGDDDYKAARARAALYRSRAGGNGSDEDDEYNGSDGSLSSGDVPVYEEGEALDLSPATRRLLSAQALAQLPRRLACGERPPGQQPAGGEHDDDEVRIFRLQGAGLFFVFRESLPRSVKVDPYVCADVALRHTLLVNAGAAAPPGWEACINCCSFVGASHPPCFAFSWVLQPIGCGIFSALFGPFHPHERNVASLAVVPTLETARR